MRWSSAVATGKVLEDVVRTAAQAAEKGLKGRPANLAFVFVTRHFARQYDELRRILRHFVDFEHLLGCSAGGVIGGGSEIELEPGLSLTLAYLPQVQIEPIACVADHLPDEDAPPGAWAESLGLSRQGTPNFILLADPFSFPAPKLLTGLDYAFPASIKIGGLASGASQPGGNALFLDDRVHRTGLVGLALEGNLRIETVVAQGCRPVGNPLRVTRGGGHVVQELENRPAMEAIRDLLASLSGRDRKLATQSLFLGVARDDLGTAPEEYLIRNIMGLDPSSGALVVAENLHSGQVVRFHVRDAEASSQDLQLLLNRFRQEKSGLQARGALLFSCLGRGIHLYGHPNHDSDCFRERIGDVPLGGFFCNGEIGPVGNATHLHGFTSAFGIFGPAED